MADFGQRLDLMSPLQQVMSKIADAFKQALPDSAKVKIELEPTPMEEVNASIARTKDVMSDSASSKLAQGDGKGSSSSEEYDKAMKRIDAIGSRLGYLLQKIEGGKDATGNAAMEAERLKDSLSLVADKARDAAKAMGKDGLASKIDEAEAAAGMGKNRPQQQAHGAGAGDLMSMLRNPEAAMQRGLMGMVENILGGSGGGGGIMSVLGPVAAVGGGIYGGWKINEHLAGQAVSDSQKAIRDAMLSNAAGGGFDLRGELYDEKRSGVKTWGGTWDNGTSRKNYVSNEEIRRVLSGSGISFNNWSGGGAVIDSSMDIAKHAYGMGVGTEQMAGIVGAGIKTGAVSPTEASVTHYLQIIAGATDKAAQQGISTNEKLGVIASLNQRTVQAMGFLSPELQKLNLQASGALEATGDPALKGQLGAGVLQTMAGNGNDASRARMLGTMLDGNGKLKGRYLAMVQANPMLSRMLSTEGDVITANAMLDDPTMRASVAQPMWDKMLEGGISPLQAGRLTGVNSGSSMKDYLAVDAGLRSKSIFDYRLTENTNPLRAGTKAGKALDAALEATWADQNKNDVNKTGYDAEASRNLNEAATKLKSFVNDFERAIFNNSSSNGGYQFNGTELIPVVGAPWAVWRAIR
jgi:hypothetical protein